MTPTATPSRDFPNHLAARHLLLALALGLVAGLGAATAEPWPAALLIGWSAAAASYLVPVWTAVLRHDADATGRHATRVDASRVVTDTTLLAASVASLGTVAVLLATSRYTGLAIVSVVLSWSVVHTVFTLRYARLYYRDVPGGVDFNDDDPPTYRDFAYLAFTIGMTYQVSDTSLTSSEMRWAALGHALLSFVFGTAVIATTINLVATLLR